MAVRPLSINFSTGIIRWEHGSMDGDEISVQQPLSPFYLRRLAEVDKTAEQARKGFRSLEDLSAAEASRNRQGVSTYPTTKEETDVSKEAGKLLRQLDREERRTERKKRKEFQPVVNLATGRIKWS